MSTEEGITSLLVRIQKLERRNNRLHQIIQTERNARKNFENRLRFEKSKAAEAAAQITSLSSQLEVARHSLDHARSNIDNGIDCFKAAHSRVIDAQGHLKNMASARQFPATSQPSGFEQPQNSRSRIVLPTQGEPQPKLQARVNPMVQGVELRKPSIHLFRLSSSILREYSDNAGSSSATAATPTTPPTQQAADPQGSMQNQSSMQETVYTESPDVNEEPVNQSVEVLMSRTSHRRRQ